MAPVGINRTKIFVGHLPDGCSNQDLKSLFEKYGVVAECDVINKYGFVHMSSSEEADAAIKALNNFNFMGSCISVEPSTSKLHPEPGAPGRAPGDPMRRGGGPPRNGYSRESYYTDTSYYDDYRRGYDSSMAAPPRDPYYSRDRARPYPVPYERRAPPLREDPYSRRPLDDPYTRRLPPTTIPTHEDPYDRRPRATTDYMYSRRSPPPSTQRSCGWDLRLQTKEHHKYSQAS